MKGKKNLNGVTLAERPAAYGLADRQGSYSDSRQTLAAVVRHFKMQKAAAVMFANKRVCLCRLTCRFPSLPLGLFGSPTE